MPRTVSGFLSVSVAPGTPRSTGDVRVRVLHPPPPDWERRRVRNDDSVVLEIVYRDVALLLTGDISAEIEREILPQLTHAQTRILKVAHHGSRTSSSLELLDGWRPQFALISAGRGNTFGHPAQRFCDDSRRLGHGAADRSRWADQCGHRRERVQSGRFKEVGHEGRGARE